MVLARGDGALQVVSGGFRSAQLSEVMKRIVPYPETRFWSSHIYSR